MLPGHHVSFFISTSGYTPVTRPVLVQENSPTNHTIVLKAETVKSQVQSYHSIDQLAALMGNLSAQFPDYAKYSRYCWKLRGICIISIELPKFILKRCVNTLQSTFINTMCVVTRFLALL